MEVLGEWVELTGSDWQGPVMLLGDLKILDFLFASQLPERDSLISCSVYARTCLHWVEAGSLTPDFHLYKIFQTSAVLTF